MDFNFIELWLNKLAIIVRNCKLFNYYCSKLKINLKPQEKNAKINFFENE